MNDSTIITDLVKRFKWVGSRPIRPDGVPKVTGRALYGADLKLPGMLYGKILRSPHAHARIKSIDTSAAEALPGVKAIMTAADLPEQKFDYIGPERVAVNFWHVTRNVLAREKALYEGHAIAAVAAISSSIAEDAAALIKVDYEVLPHVIDVDEAMAPDAPLLFENMITRGIEPPPTKPSNISKRLEFAMGDVEAGFKEADVVIEKEFKTAAVHQAYIEPHACVAKYEADGQCEIWSSSQGHFQMRALTAQIIGARLGDLRVTPAEIGGGFGGKTVTYLEPVASILSKKSGLPVRLQMTREDTFRALRPDLRRVDVGEDRRQEGRHDRRGRWHLQVPGWRVPGLAGDERLPVRLRAVRDRQPARRRFRCRFQPAEGGGVSRARLADLGLRGRERARHVRQGNRHGPAGNTATRTPAASARRPLLGRSTHTPAISRRSRR